MARTWVGALIPVVMLAGSASRPDEISAAYISPVQYLNYDCSQIQAELQRVSARVSQLHGTIDEKATGDVVAMGVGLLLFWPSLFFIDGNGPEAQEYARLKGEYEALQRASVERRCGLGPPAPPSTQVYAAPAPAPGYPPANADAPPAAQPAPDRYAGIPTTHPYPTGQPPAYAGHAVPGPDPYALAAPDPAPSRVPPVNPRVPSDGNAFLSASGRVPRLSQAPGRPNPSGAEVLYLGPTTPDGRLASTVPRRTDGRPSRPTTPRRRRSCTWLPACRMGGSAPWLGLSRGSGFAGAASRVE